MNKKEIIHLLKNCFALKKQRYFYSAASIVVLVAVRSLYQVVFITETIYFALNILLFLVPYYYLFSSELIPSNPKAGAKASSATYSLSYLFPILNSFGSYVSAVVVELFIDALILVLPILIIVKNLNVFLIALVVALYFLMLIRFTSFSKVISSYKGRYKTLHKFQSRFSQIALYSLTIVFAILVSRWGNVTGNLTENISYVLIVILVGVLVTFPISIFEQLKKDKTYVPNNNHTLIYVFLFLDLILFYFADPFDQIIPKNQKIFRYIEAGQVEEIKKLMTIDKKTLSYRDHINNFPPLLYAVHKGQPEIAKLFLDNGASITDIGKHKLNVLHLASQKCYPDLALQLVDKGIDINSLSDKRRNALFYASKNRCYSLVIYFKRMGVDTTLRDVENKDFKQYARFDETDTSFDSDYNFYSEIGVFDKE